MSGFIGKTPSAKEDDFIVDDFFPALNLAIFREQYRIDSSYTTAALLRVLSDAALDITDDLADFVAEKQASGFATLSDVPARKIAGQSRLVLLFIRAISCFAKANLMDSFVDVDTTRDLGKDRGEDRALSNAFWLREGRTAINKMNGRPSVESTLI